MPPSRYHTSSRIGLFALALGLAACAGGPAKAAIEQHDGAVPLATAFAMSGGVPAIPIVTPRPMIPGLTPMPALMPDRIFAPSIGLDAPVISTDWTTGGDWRVPNGAAGWLENSAYLNAPGNTVLAGHQNTQGEVFRRVAELQPGDSVTMGAQGQTVEYRVAEVLILPAWGTTPEQERGYASWIARTRDTRLTLITCWPYYTNSHRVIVIAKPAN
jgi:sortase A